VIFPRPVAHKKTRRAVIPTGEKKRKEGKAPSTLSSSTYLRGEARCNLEKIKKAGDGLLFLPLTSVGVVENPVSRSRGRKGRACLPFILEAVSEEVEKRGWKRGGGTISTIHCGPEGEGGKTALLWWATERKRRARADSLRFSFS